MDEIEQILTTKMNESVAESEAAAKDLVGTASNGEGSPAQTAAATEAGSQQAATTDEQTGADPAKPADNTAQAEQQTVQDNGVVDQAIASLNKVHGKQLSDEEAVEALSRSHLESEGKIRNYASQVKDLVQYRQSYELIAQDPYVQQLIRGERKIGQVIEAAPHQQEETFAEDSLDPAVKKTIEQLQRENAETKAQLNKFITEGQNKEGEAAIQKAQEKIATFAKKDTSFRQAYRDFQADKELNPYTAVPEPLKKFAAMCDLGFKEEEAWAMVTGNYEKNLKTKIALDQVGKQAANTIAKPSRGQAVKHDLTKAASVEEMMRLALENASIAQ